ncbi:hypothetical protein [Serratia ficaria]|uniref:hypothetical protein n=1 Tax=Serratia ficaria TaxID=61651 RepID=UPI0021C5A6F1|nr:hypothetical protein [Serratia ficaria]
MDKLNEESRRQFEEFYRHEYLRGDEALARSSVTGSYIYAHAQGHWKSWTRSRLSIVVELPTEHDLRQVVCGECASESLELVESRIRSIGLSIKGE